MESIAQAINKSSTASTSLSHNEAMKQHVTCPGLTCYDSACMYINSIKYMIIHLNDEHKWSREDIADWLDTLENQPVFYPDIRTDDEKIEDAKKETQLVSAYGVNNPIAGAWIKSPQAIANAMSYEWDKKFLQDLLPKPGPAQSGPVQYYQSTPASSYNTYASQLAYGGLNAGSTVTLQYGGSTISGYVESIEAHYSGYKGTTYTVTFHSF